MICAYFMERSDPISRSFPKILAIDDIQKIHLIFAFVILKN